MCSVDFEISASIAASNAQDSGKQRVFGNDRQLSVFVNDRAFRVFWCGVYLVYVTNAPISKQIFAYDVQPDDAVQNRRLSTWRAKKAWLALMVCVDSNA